MTDLNVSSTVALSPSVPPSVSWLNWLDTLVDIWLINAANASLSAFLSVKALPVPQIYCCSVFLLQIAHGATER